MFFLISEGPPGVGDGVGWSGLGIFPQKLLPGVGACARGGGVIIGAGGAIINGAEEGSLKFNSSSSAVPFSPMARPANATPPPSVNPAPAPPTKP